MQRPPDDPEAHVYPPELQQWTFADCLLALRVTDASDAQLLRNLFAEALAPMKGKPGSDSANAESIARVEALLTSWGSSHEYSINNMSLSNVLKFELWSGEIMPYFKALTDFNTMPRQLLEHMAHLELEGQRAVDTPMKEPSPPRSLDVSDNFVGKPLEERTLELYIEGQARPIFKCPAIFLYSEYRSEKDGNILISKVELTPIYTAMRSLPGYKTDESYLIDIRADPPFRIFNDDEIRCSIWD